MVLIEKLESFNLDKLVPYDASYLAGTQAQAYDLMLEDVWIHARQQMRTDMNKACRKKILRQHRNFSMKMDFVEESWRYILVPIYLATYRYNNQVWQVIVQSPLKNLASRRDINYYVAKALY